MPRDMVAAAALAAGAALLLYLLTRRRTPKQAPQSPVAALASPPRPVEPPSDIHVLHSGGLASDASEMLQAALAKATSGATTCHLHSMTDFKKFSTQYALVDRASPLHVVFIVATIENEQPPEDAGPCVRFFNRRTHAPDMLANRLVYAVLGLGDSNLLLDRQTTTAKDCNQVARRLDSRLAALGGKRFHAIGETDDRTGNQELDPWIASCVAELAR